MDDINREESSALLRYVLKHGEPGHVACKPTHPDVTVTLQRINQPGDDKSAQVCKLPSLTIGCQLVTKSLSCYIGREIC